MRKNRIPRARRRQGAGRGLTAYDLAKGRIHLSVQVERSSTPFAAGQPAGIVVDIGNDAVRPKLRSASGLAPCRLTLINQAGSEP